MSNTGVAEGAACEQYWGEVAEGAACEQPWGAMHICSGARRRHLHSSGVPCAAYRSLSTLLGRPSAQVVLVVNVATK